MFYLTGALYIHGGVPLVFEIAYWPSNNGRTGTGQLDRYQRTVHAENFGFDKGRGDVGVFEVAQLDGFDLCGLACQGSSVCNFLKKIVCLDRCFAFVMCIDCGRRLFGMRVEFEIVLEKLL